MKIEETSQLVICFSVLAVSYMRQQQVTNQQIQSTKHEEIEM